MNNKKSKQRDLLLVAAVLIVAGILYLGNWFLNQKPAVLVEISVNGEIIKTADLAKNQELTIDGHDGGTNHIVIKDGEAHISDASCPDKLCIHQGDISQTGEMIVCLPNQMIAKITSEITQVP